jgi:hypothetical protein
MLNLPNHSSRVIRNRAGSPPYEVTVTPPQIEFGNTVRYSSSVVLQATVTNTGKYPVEIKNITAAGDFAVSHTAPTFLLPSKHFLINITFQPMRIGTQVGGVYVDTGDSAGTEYIKLIGRGIITDDGGGTNPGEDGVTPKFWSWKGNGEDRSFPLEGADVFDKLFYDTAMEATPEARDFLVVKPNDFVIREGVDGSPPVIEFLIAPEENQEGFTTLRGYAKPWTGPPPITQVGPRIITSITANNTIIDRITANNSLILINSPTPFNLRIRNKLGIADENWKNGDFFSVMQVGIGPVTVLMQDGDDLTPPVDFVTRTRGVNTVISATCFNADGDQWVSSGDLLRTTSSSDKGTISLVDRTVLLGSGMNVGTNKDTYHMPYGMKLDPIVDGGLYASLLTAQAGGTIFTVDVLRNGVSILENKLLINNTQKTSKTSVTPASYVEGGDLLAVDDEVTISIVQVGDGSARGLRVYLVGQRV